MIKFQSKFTLLAEQAVERYQQGGLLNGDYVTIVKNIKSSDFYKNSNQTMRDKIDEFVESDQHLRVSAIKSAVYAQMPVDGGMNAANDFYADVIQEYAPGLYKDPITMPINLVELVDTADALGRVQAPESKVYDNKINSGTDGENLLPQQDTKLANTNSWNDKAPGGGNTKDLQSLKESTLTDAYDSMYK